MKQLLIALTLIAATAATLNAQSRKYDIKVNDFTQLKVNGSINVDYRQSADSAGTAVFTSSSDMVSLFTFEPKKDVLNIIFKPLEGYSTPVGLPTITVYSRFLRSVDYNGDSLMRVLSIAPAPEFKVKSSGSGHITVRNLQTNSVSATVNGRGSINLRGATTEASFSLLGSGSIQALDLPATTVKCSVISSGYIECAPSQQLIVKGAGNGKVYYTGTPLINDKWMLGGKIINLDAQQ